MHHSHNSDMQLHTGKERNHYQTLTQDLVENQCMISQCWSRQWGSFWYDQGSLTIMVWPQNNIATSWDPGANVIWVVGKVQTTAWTFLGHFPTRSSPIPQDGLRVIRAETWIMMTDNSLHFLSKANKLGAVRKDRPKRLNGLQPNPHGAQFHGMLLAVTWWN